MIPYAHIPTEKHILYLFNDAMPSHEAARHTWPKSWRPARGSGGKSGPGGAG